jgi:hypothetical protein
MFKNKIDSILIVFSIICLFIIGYLYASRMIDFPVYYHAGRSLLSGRTDLYAPDFAHGILMDYRYPPVFLYLFLPIWLLPYKAASYVWYTLCAINLYICYLVLHRIIKKYSSENNYRLLWITLTLLMGKYIVLNMRYGNAQLLVTCLLFLSLYFYLERKILPAAFSIALAISIKLMPVILLPYFLIKRQYKFLVLTGVMIIVINSIPAVHLGMRNNFQQLKVWYHHVIANQEFHETNGPINLSLKGQLKRYLTNIDYKQRLDGDANYPQVNIASISASHFEVIWKIGAATLYLLCLGLIAYRQYGLTNNPTNEDHSSVLELGIMLCLMVLINPLSSFLYFIAMLWPTALLLTLVAMNDNTNIATRSKQALIFIAIINCFLPMLPGSYMQRLILLLGADFYVAVILLISTGYVYQRIGARS